MQKKLLFRLYTALETKDIKISYPKGQPTKPNDTSDDKAWAAYNNYVRDHDFYTYYRFGQYVLVHKKIATRHIGVGGSASFSSGGYTLCIYPNSKKWSEFSGKLQPNKDVENFYNALTHKVHGEPYDNPFVERVERSTEELKRYAETAGMGKQMLKEIEALKQKLLTKQNQKQK